MSVDTFPPGELLEYVNRSYQMGRNTQVSARNLAPAEAAELINVDIRSPNQRTRRAAPQWMMTGPGGIIQGMIAFTTGTGTSALLAIADGEVCAAIGPPLQLVQVGSSGSPPTISTTTLCFLQQGLGPSVHSPGSFVNCMYGTDGVNGVFKYDGYVASQPTILAADGVTQMTACNDILYFMNRMWYAIGDYIYFSDVGNPESITNAPMTVGLGAGDHIIKLLDYRDTYILVFKSGTNGLGSITIIDVSSNTPSSFIQNVNPLYNNLSLRSPRAVRRITSNTDADVLYWTDEGLRTLAFTALDTLLGPSVPLTFSEPDIVGSVVTSDPNAVHANVFDDEIILWMRTGSQTGPGTCIAASRQIPGNSPVQGWVQLTFPGAYGVKTLGNVTCSIVLAPGSFSSQFGDTAALLIGDSSSQIWLAFAQTGSNNPNQYTEIGRRIDHDKFGQNIIPEKLLIETDEGHVGPFTPTIFYPDGTYLTLASTSGNGKNTFAYDLRQASLGGVAKQTSDAQLQMTATSDVVFLGYKLQSMLETDRYIDINTNVSALPSASIYSQAQLTPAFYKG